jgi:fatty-acyl-CoA synthase
VATQLSYSSGPADTGLLGITIGDLLDRTVAAHGANEALVSRHQGIRWTYAEFGQRVDRLARALMTLGVTR